MRDKTCSKLDSNVSFPWESPGFCYHPSTSIDVRSPFWLYLCHLTFPFACVIITKAARDSKLQYVTYCKLQVTCIIVKFHFILRFSELNWLNLYLGAAVADPFEGKQMTQVVNMSSDNSWKKKNTNQVIPSKFSAETLNKKHQRL